MVEFVPMLRIQGFGWHFPIYRNLEYGTEWIAKHGFYHRRQETTAGYFLAYG